MMRRRVAVFRNTFLRPSEVWLYNHLVEQERYEARIYCRRRINADRFPFPASAIRSVEKGGGLAVRAEEAMYAAFRRSPRLLRSLETFRPEVIHAHFGVDGVYALPFAERLGRPLVVSVHGYDVSRLPRLQLLPISWLNYYLHFDRLADRAVRFIAHTEFKARQLEALGVPRTKICVHYLGIPVGRYAVEPSGRARPRNILFVGRFVAVKGLEHLLRAFAGIAERFPDSRLILIGSGPLEEDIRRRVGELGLGGRVDLPGFVNQERLGDWFANAAVFCHPSVTTRHGEAEGIVVSILEAQAGGLPVVATRHGGIPEGVVEGETGLLVEERDVTALEKALATLLEDRDRREAMSRAAANHVRERFDVRRQASRLEDIYDDILGTLT